MEKFKERKIIKLLKKSPEDGHKKWQSMFTVVLLIQFVKIYL